MISERVAVKPMSNEGELDNLEHKENELARRAEETPASTSAGRITLERPKGNYKNIPDDWKAIPPGRFRKAIGHLEAVLLEISADGTDSSNVFDWKPTLPTLQAWANHLRSALKDLTKA
jgi:hypothetical protein